MTAGDIASIVTAFGTTIAALAGLAAVAMSYVNNLKLNVVHEGVGEVMHATNSVQDKLVAAMSAAASAATAAAVAASAAAAAVARAEGIESRRSGSD